LTSFWNEQDFEVFETQGLEARMNLLTERVRPKFVELGSLYSSFFSAATGDEFFSHVAKHMRRTVNPPNDSWVAFAPHKRGYKAVPHFQIGLWNSHIFIILAVIYEAPGKAAMAQNLLDADVISSLPNGFVISGDHMKPDAAPLSEMPDEELNKLITRLRDIKKGEFVIGRHIPREQAVNLSEEDFQEFAEETFAALLPVYRTLLQKEKTPQR
jgi:uncharacterized protein YktB (UPF0637 family)